MCSRLYKRLFGQGMLTRMDLQSTDIFSVLPQVFAFSSRVEMVDILYGSAGWLQLADGAPMRFREPEIALWRGWGFPVCRLPEICSCHVCVCCIARCLTQPLFILKQLLCIYPEDAAALYSFSHIYKVLFQIVVTCSSGQNKNLKKKKNCTACQKYIYLLDGS